MYAYSNISNTDYTRQPFFLNPVGQAFIHFFFPFLQDIISEESVCVCTLHGPREYMYFSRDLSPIEVQ